MQFFLNTAITFFSLCASRHALVGGHCAAEGNVAMGNKRKQRGLSRVRKRRVGQRSRSSTSGNEADEEFEISDDSCNLDLSSGSDSESPECDAAAAPDSANSSDSELDNEDASSQSDDDELRAGNRIVNLDCLQSILEESCMCSQCKSGSIEVMEVQRCGLASTIQLVCQDCAVTIEAPLSKKSHHHFQVNRQSTIAMRMIGRRRMALRKVCAVMDLPEPVRKEPFQSHSKALHKAAATVATDSMRNHAEQLRKSEEEAGDEHPEQVAVSTDGTWMRRG